MPHGWRQDPCGTGRRVADFIGHATIHASLLTGLATDLVTSRMVQQAKLVDGGAWEEADNTNVAGFATESYSGRAHYQRLSPGTQT